MLSDIFQKRVRRILQSERRHFPQTFNLVLWDLHKRERNLEFDVPSERIHDGLHADFKLSPELSIVVRRRSHVRDGSSEIVVGGVHV